MAEHTEEQVTSKQYSEEQFTGKLPYTLTNDFFFKAFLQRNEDALRGLLCAMLSMESEEITDIVITNPIKEGEEIDDKKMILDVKLEVNHTQTINLEMQVEARERYRRDLVAAQDFGREQREEEIKELKNNLQQSQEEIAKLEEEKIKFQEESSKFQEEKAEMCQRIRFLEEQLAKTNKE